ncbi:MAG: hypothetical protein AB1502_17120 [Thermodesulfobacteriota bacterium]
MDKRTIAYFSMEIALVPGMPTYSGGLGVLAGDTIRSAADLHIPMAAMTVLHLKGEGRDPSKDAEALYDKLERVILPLFYDHRDRFIDVMCQTIALNDSFFNTQRMLQQDVLNAYFR